MWCMGGRYVRRRVCMVRRISGVEVIVAMQTALLVCWNIVCGYFYYLSYSDHKCISRRKQTAPPTQSKTVKGLHHQRRGIDVHT